MPEAVRIQKGGRHDGKKKIDATHIFMTNVGATQQLCKDTEHLSEDMKKLQISLYMYS